MAKKITDQVNELFDTSEPLTPERIRYFQNEIVRALHYLSMYEYPISYKLKEKYEKDWYKLQSVLEDMNLCGKPHNNGEDTCNECLTIKESI